MRSGWAEVRYRWLLPLARGGRARGRAYARIVARVERASDPERVRVASARIARALSLDPVRAERVYRGCLYSEALEEADSVYFMHRPALDPALFQFDELPEALDGARPANVGTNVGTDVGTIFGTLHFGAPVLCYLALCARLGGGLSIVGRPLDDANPMPESKRTYARAKVRWAEQVAGRPFIATDSAAMAQARDELLAGRSLFTPIDVPGSVARRAATVPVFGEPVRFACGLMTLARLTGATVVPVVAASSPDGIRVRFGQRLDPGGGADDLLGRALGELLRFVRTNPDEWWMWPYLEPAR
ncbi:MAG: hypothetical protein FJ148_08985 [Deltaproteobacteria bacterium]|nr:hypothetical protein [Deltaproteobacteria bacterium]